MHETFTVQTEDRLTVTDVTDRVRETIPADASGTCTVYVRHTTAGVVVQEAEPRLLDDIRSFLRETVADEGWRHDEIDDNADSHLRATLLGESVTVPVVDGSLDTGTWQSILLVECDGPRRREVAVVA